MALLRLRYALGETGTHLVGGVESDPGKRGSQPSSVWRHQVGIKWVSRTLMQVITKMWGERYCLQEANMSLLFPYPSRIKQKLGRGHVLAIYYLQGRFELGRG